MSRILQMLKHPVMNNFKIILGGNIATQIVSLATYSIIARRFSTEEFGLAAFFLSLTFVVSIFQNGQVYWSLLSTDNDESKQLSNYHDSVAYLVLTTPFLILISCLAIPWGEQQLGWMIVLVPIFSFFYSLIEINKTIANASGHPKAAASQVFFSRSYGQGLKILLSFINRSGFVLILSELLANLYVGIKGGKVSLTEIKKRVSFQLVTKYKKHILFYAPVNLLNLIIQELPVILATYIYGMKAAGSYFLISRLVLNPITLVGNSFAISQVKTINSYNESPVSKKKFLVKSYSLLTLAGVIPAIILYFFGPQIFEIFLGKGHEETALLTRTLAVFLPFRMIKAMSLISGINADLYKESLFNKGILMICLISIPFIFKDLTFENMVIILLILESISDTLLALVGLKSKKEAIVNI